MQLPQHINQTFNPHRSCVLWWNTGWCFTLKVRHMLERYVWVRPLLLLEAASEESVIKNHQKQTWIRTSPLVTTEGMWAYFFSFTSSASPNIVSQPQQIKATRFWSYWHSRQNQKLSKVVSPMLLTNNRVQCSGGNKQTWPPTYSFWRRENTSVAISPLLESRKKIKVNVSYPVQKYPGKYTQNAGVTLRKPLELLGEFLLSKRRGPGGEP